MERPLDSFLNASGNHWMFQARWKLDCRRIKDNGGLEYECEEVKMEKSRRKLVLLLINSFLIYT